MERALRPPSGLCSLPFCRASGFPQVLILAPIQTLPDSLELLDCLCSSALPGYQALFAFFPFQLSTFNSWPFAPPPNPSLARVYQPEGFQTFPPSRGSVLIISVSMSPVQQLSHASVSTEGSAIALRYSVLQYTKDQSQRLWSVLTSPRPLFDSSVVDTLIYRAVEKALASASDVGWTMNCIL